MEQWIKLVAGSVVVILIIFVLATLLGFGPLATTQHEPLLDPAIPSEGEPIQVGRESHTVRNGNTIENIISILNTEKTHVITSPTLECGFTIITDEEVVPQDIAPGKVGTFYYAAKVHTTRGFSEDQCLVQATGLSLPEFFITLLER